MAIAGTQPGESATVTLEGTTVITGTLSGLLEPAVTVIQINGGNLLPGTPTALPGSTLPANYKWADRSAVLFSDWPDLQAVYDAGLLDVLSANATDEEKTAHPRKWVLNGCGNGLFLPDIGGRFAREWRPGQTDDAGREAGSRQGDAIRNITGGVSTGGSGVPGIETHGQGAFGDVGTGNGAKTSGVKRNIRVDFDASRVVPTADENRPMNDAQPVAVYMGRRAQDLA